MKQRINTMMGAVMLTGALALAVAGCEKTYNTPVENNAAASDAATASQWADSIPGVLQVSGENKLADQAYATGVQIYEVQRSATDNNVFQWVNIAPSATLYSKPDYTKQTGTHYKGPTWEFTKGPLKEMKVVATKLQGVTKDPTAVQWLLLKAVDSLSSANNKITYIQRIFTHGGVAPATVPGEENLGQKDSIPYTAVYLFYEAKH